MANIAITNICNLKCEYCFADDMIHEPSSSISLEDFIKILQFTSRTPKNHIGIIGGEPTLHPEFDKIIKEINIYCRENNTGATLFTNGIELEKYLPMLCERIGMLINCNSPDKMSIDQYKKLSSTLDKINELCMFDTRCTCGCNVYLGCDNYYWIWEIVDKYHLPHIRCSVVSPGGCYRNMRSDKELYYNMMKPIFLNFCTQAKDHNCKLHMDCGKIPLCYFDQFEKEIVLAACDNYMESYFCHPVVDITQGFRATACFGCYDPVDIRDFNTVDELEDYLFIRKNIPRYETNCTGKCTTCKKHELFQCQGGCLGFAEVN